MAKNKHDYNYFTVLLPYLKYTLFYSKKRREKKDKFLFCKNALHQLNIELLCNLGMRKLLKIPTPISMIETMNKIIEEKKSVSRFGDGEFRFAIGDTHLGNVYFATPYNEQLKNRLQEVLASNKDNHLVCIWDNFASLRAHTTGNKCVARQYMMFMRDKFQKVLNFEQEYGNAFISRPYLVYKNKKITKKVFSLWKKLWNNRDVILIEGAYTKFGIGNDLLSNVKSVKRILCPEENAWEKYDEILEYSKTLPKDHLILIALGMSATVLAYDLAKLGYQAIDIGHLDIEYECFLRETSQFEAIAGKYCNDALKPFGATSYKDSRLSDSPQYRNEIMKIFSHNQNKYIVANNKCSGCSTCFNSCPAGAISMKENSEGFLYPVVNQDKCVKCGKCIDVCQIGKFDKLVENGTRRYFAARHKDKLELASSSSGGVISLIAKNILQKGGYVCAATYENGKLFHKVIDNYNDFMPMKGSKYFQSELADIFKTLKNLLNDNKPVVFIGTPCQVAGLKMYLRKDYDHLLLIDIICHGVPSKKVFNKFLKENHLENLAKSAIHLTMRSKKIGWHQHCLNLTNNHQAYYGKLLDISFGKAFAYELCLRNSCHTCPYSNTKRVGDIMVGDYWGIDRLGRNLDDNLGWSLVSFNAKGEAVFNQIKHELDFIQSREGLSVQPNLLYPTRKHPNRERFFKQIETDSLENTTNRLLNKENNIGILNFYWENNNYGAILTAYALNKYLNNLGYNAYNIQYLPTISAYSKPTADFEEFRLKYIPQTYKCTSADDFEFLNNCFGTYVVGSDQVFRWSFVRNENDVYYLKFASADSKKIAYSASFGISRFEGDYAVVKHVKKLLSRFWKLGIREKSGVALCRNLFDLKATHVLDPVFLLNNKQWDEISSNNSAAQYDCVHYIINPELESELKEKLKSSCNIRWNLKVQDWISVVKNAKFVVTDSFHGVCFCIIFKKQFACVVSKNSPYERILSLFEILNFPLNNFYIGPEAFELEKSKRHITDYSSVQEKLDKGIILSKSFLNNSLSEKSDTLEEIVCLRNKVLELSEQGSDQKLDWKSLRRKLFSVTRSLDQKHKIIRLFGLKLRIEEDKTV